jgi:hypothetical protein
MRKIFTLPVILALFATPVTKAFSQAVPGSLPVVLVVFTADVTPNQEVMLNWTVQQQFVPYVFNVERSCDGLAWQSITTITSSGPSSKPVSYAATDKMPLNGVNYYRVRIRSHDGSSGHTEAKGVQVKIMRSPRLYPNPASDFVHVSLVAIPKSDYWTLTIFDPYGQQVLQKKYSNYFTSVDIPVRSFPDGLYNIEIADGSNRHMNTLLISRH